MTAFEARLAQIDALRREAAARLGHQADSEAVAATALVIADQLMTIVDELSETVGVLCWAARRMGLDVERARMAMLVDFARSQVNGGASGVDRSVAE